MTDAASSARAEHEQNEKQFSALLNLLALAPKHLRGRSAWESLLPPSALPRPTALPEYLDQCEGRAREAAGKLPRPLSAVLIPIFGARRFREAQDREAARVAGLCRLLGGEEAPVEQAIGEAFARLSLPVKAAARLEPAGRSSARLMIDLPGQDVVPARRSSLLKDGRISYRNFPDRERNEAYARVVASLALLHAAAALDAAPSIETLVVNGTCPAIDPRTGMDTVVCLISVQVERAVLEGLRLERLDPVAALENFPHRFEVGRGAALKPVEALEDAAPRDVEIVEPLDAPAPRIPRDARRAAAPATSMRAPAAASAPLASEQEGEIAADALRVAIACARSDGRFEDSELRAIGQLIEERFSPTALEKKRLDLLREELKGGAIDPAQAAGRLRARLTPLERRLLVEGIFSALNAKGSVADPEVRLLETVALQLDLPPLTLLDIGRRAGASPAGPGTRREKWLAALDLPADSNVTRELVERGARRILDTYAEHRFAALGAEFQTLARDRRAGAEEARRELLAGLGEAPAPAPPEAPRAATDPQRNNPDLDAVFGG
jgi:uncharacterized tellurite resistance protein B-like protein